MLIRDGGRDEFDGPNDPELKQTIQGFANMCRTSGMSVEDRPPIFVEAHLPSKRDDTPVRSNCLNVMRTALMSLPGKPKFVMVVLSSGDKNVYNGVKHLCDSYLDLPTVCVHAAKIRKERGQLQYFANVALKVCSTPSHQLIILSHLQFNMKLGGVNHVLDQGSMAWLRKTPTMLVGMDVTHPGPGSVKGTPSIAAVVASVDEKYAQYPASMELQESKKEVRRPLHHREDHLIVLPDDY